MTAIKSKTVFLCEPKWAAACKTDAVNVVKYCTASGYHVAYVCDRCVHELKMTLPDSIVGCYRFGGIQS